MYWRHRALSLLVLLPACTGTLDAGPSRASRSSPVASSTSLRRLTGREYVNTVQAALGAPLSSEERALLPSDPLSAVTGFPAPGAIGAVELDRYMGLAERASERLAPELVVRSGCTVEDAGCAERVLDALGPALQGGALGADERAASVALYTMARTAGATHLEAIADVTTSLLLSPGFLYLTGVGDPSSAGPTRLTGREIARRLAVALWASGPDAVLIEAAESGRLESRDGVEAEARRMLADPRAAEGLFAFHAAWLGLLPAETLARRPGAPPGFEPVRLEEGLRSFLFDAVTQGGGLEALLMASHAYVDETTAPLRGATVPPGSGLVRVELRPAHAAGVLTDPLFLASRAHDTSTSPTARGRTIRERVLCGTVGSPPPDADLSPLRPDEGLDMRARMIARTAPERCTACHRLMDPIGFAFEPFDAFGALHPDVDSSGLVNDPPSGSAPWMLSSSADLGRRLAADRDVQRCYVRHWFRWTMRRLDAPSDRAVLAGVDERFDESGHDVRELIVALVTSDAFLVREGR